MSTFDNIVMLLKQQNKKQKDLTDYLGITKNAFTDWKSGRIKSYQKYLPEIAAFFGVTVDFLVGNNAENPESLNNTFPLQDDVIIYCRNGETVRKKFTKEQMDYLEKFIHTISGEDSPDF